MGVRAEQGKADVVVGGSAPGRPSEAAPVQLPLSTVLGTLAREASANELAAAERCCEACGRPFPILASLDAPAEPSRKARRRDPASAKNAARHAFPKAGQQRHRLLCAVASSPSGLTSEEAGRAARCPYVSASTRVTELRDGGWLEDSGRTRKTSSGTDATVWRLTRAARDALMEQAAA